MDKVTFKEKLQAVRKDIKQRPDAFNDLKDQVGFSPMNWKKTDVFNRGGRSQS